MISTTNRFLLCPALVVLMLSVGCASISQDTIAAIKSPVRCDVADRDIAFLEDEKAGGFRRSLAGVTAILPPGSFIVIIRGILGMPRGIWVDKWRVAFGTYNDKMDEKIERTRQQCGTGDTLR